MKPSQTPSIFASAIRQLQVEDTINASLLALHQKPHGAGEVSGVAVPQMVRFKRLPPSNSNHDLYIVHIVYV
jgi:hypothetical protein